LLTHDHHADNLGTDGLALLSKAGVFVTIWDAFDAKTLPVRGGDRSSEKERLRPAIRPDTRHRQRLVPV
jgi:hypothetical protein